MKSFKLIEELLIELEADNSLSVEREYVIFRIRKVSHQLKMDKNASITWSVSDFESRAREIELAEKEMPEEVVHHYVDSNSPTSKKMSHDFRLFDRKKFRRALGLMLAKHDASIGINWNTIDSYLFNHCKLP